MNCEEKNNMIDIAENGEKNREILLEASHLSVNFPVKKTMFFEKQKYLQAVTDVSLRIYKGETFGLVGESGCGKSTFANTTLGITKPTSGELFFAGEDMQQISKERKKELRKRMQKIFQDPSSSLNPRFTVFELVSEPLTIRGGYSEDEKRAMTEAILKKVGLSKEDMERYPSDFSGGQQQRIAIARALILKPDYLVCDEPVSALDVSVHAQILNLLMEMQKEMGITYLFISHNLAVVKKMCDRLAIMYLGKVVEYGSAEKIFANPKHPYTKALIDSVLDIDVDLEKKQTVLKGDVSSPIDPPKGCRFCKRCPQAGERCEQEICSPVEVEQDHYVVCNKIANIIKQ